MRTAVIGLGEMGGPIAGHLAAAQHDVTVFDLDPARIAAAEEAGCRAADSAGTAAKDAEIVHLVVFTDAAVRSVVLGADGTGGLLDVMQPGSVLVVHSTILPQSCRDIADAGRSRRIDVLDAGMTGAGAAARSGQLTLLVGGPDEVVARVRPELAAFAATIEHVGGSGLGMIAKIINNVSMLTAGEALRQVLLVAEQAGLAKADALRVLNAGSGRSWLAEHWDAIGPLLDTADDGGPWTGMARKDSALGVALATEVGTTLPAADAVVARLAALDAAR